jgi:hypothetical protein
MGIAVLAILLISGVKFLYRHFLMGCCMKKSNFRYLAAVLCILLMNNSAWPHGHGGGFGGHYGGGYGRHYGGGLGGFALGYGLGYGPFGGYGLYGGYGGYGGYGYAYPPVIAVPSTPPVYIQRNVVPPPEPNYWYYCRSAQGYYPYIQECPGGWEKVAPPPPR